MESGGAADLQASVDSVVPKFLEVVQGSIRSFAGPGDNSEQERREQEAGVIDGLCLVRGSVGRLIRLRRGQQADRAGNRERLAKVVKELSVRFKNLDESCDGYEALPESLSRLLAGGREDVKTMMAARSGQVPDRPVLELEADSLWSSGGCESFRRKLGAEATKLRASRAERAATVIQKHARRRAAMRQLRAAIKGAVILEKLSRDDGEGAPVLGRIISLGGIDGHKDTPCVDPRDHPDEPSPAHRGWRGRPGHCPVFSAWKT